MPYRILPTLFIVFVIGEVLHNILVDAIKREPFLRAAAYGHHDKRVVAVRWFLVFLVVRFR